MAESFGINSEITVDLTPTTLPKVEYITPPTPTYTPTSTPIVKSDKKMFCPKCKGTFINHTMSPDCGSPLINASKEAYEYADKHTSDGSGCSLTLGFALGFIFLPLIGIPLISCGLTGLGCFLLITYAIILFIAYGINKISQ